ncbi:mono-or diacylglycerol acyltransferase type 2 [Tribonema minus]|uniref:Acyltransferase n=1 Tax=Tribonema minus TaxID=303371 RepID=A0A835ZF37_9STRA|nr:mono-or diacylglycerol acyltransferase type 2 [Tribonema minus]
MVEVPKAAAALALRSGEEFSITALAEEEQQLNVITPSTSANNFEHLDVNLIPFDSTSTECSSDVDADDLRSEGRLRNCSCHCLEPSKSKPGFFETCLAMLTLGLVCGWFYMILLLEAALVIHAVACQCVWSGSIAALLLASCWFPLDNRYPWEAFIHGPLFKLWRRYFDWSCEVHEQLDPSRRYMFAEMPHGVIPLPALLSASVVRHAFPGLGYVMGVGADIVLRVPGIRQLYGWLGVRAAGPNTIRQMYEQQQRSLHVHRTPHVLKPLLSLCARCCLQDGVHVGVVVGGIAEMFLVSRKEERIFLQQRKGFVRVAIRNGADIVPVQRLVRVAIRNGADIVYVFFFGSSLLFDIAGGSDSNSYLMKLSRKMRSSLVPFYGRWYTTIPHRHPLKMVAGRPIRVEQSDEPDEAVVDAIHKELIKRVRDIYDNHRPAWETRPLVIL